MSKITILRKKIDKTDEKIKELLFKRAALVKEIGEVKRGENGKIKDQEREDEIIGKMENEYEKNIFNTILKESRKLQ